MHHPGPPRFLSTGETTQLAPRDPDPEATYEWRIVDAPPNSEATVGETPITEFTPDVPGHYRLGLNAPDGNHALTVRAFPAAYENVDVAGGSGEAIRDRDADRAEIPYAGDRAHDGIGRPRVRLDASVEGDAIVVDATATPNPDSELAAEDLDVTFVIDDRDVSSAIAAGRTNPRDARQVTASGSETAIETDGSGTTLRVPTRTVPDRLRVHAVAVAREPGHEPRISVADAVAVDRVGSEGSAGDASAPIDVDPIGDTDSTGRADPTGRADSPGGTGATSPDERFTVTRLNQPPEWTENARVYEVYVRTFADADEGETFDAIADRIPDLADLGVDTLWLTPVLTNDGKPHGYNITDFFDVADDLGDREDYEALVDTAHDHGLRVLFDFVANHTARDHEWFQDAYRNPDSPYRDRYEWQDSGEPGTYFDWELIANLNHSNLSVRRFLLDVVDEWAPLVDGFRCDMAWAVPDSFWRELRDRVKAMDSEFLLMDETIPYIPGFHEGMFDVHFDATLYFQLRQIGRGAAPARTVVDAVEQRAEIGFPDHAGFLQYIENHDETRYRVECGDAAAAAAGAATVTLPGVPMVYAGQEIGQRGRRDSIAWEHTRGEVRERYERLLRTHADHPALGPEGDLERVGYHVASGDLSERPIQADGDAVHPDDVVAFLRGSGPNALAVVLNFAPAEAAVAVDADHGRTNVVTGEPCVVTDGDGTERIAVDDVAVVPIGE